mmetsp:Transcript_10067/g.28280  ORF Transcript_10067/g.28280 Transcript_10067/m.28280 type:complete len:227 (+) Transcript_10067:706-1386(+)
MGWGSACAGNPVWLGALESDPRLSDAVVLALAPERPGLGTSVAWGVAASFVSAAAAADFSALPLGDASLASWGSSTFLALPSAPFARGGGISFFGLPTCLALVFVPLAGLFGGGSPVFSAPGLGVVFPGAFFPRGPPSSTSLASVAAPACSSVAPSLASFSGSAAAACCAVALGFSAEVDSPLPFAPDGGLGLVACFCPDWALGSCVLRFLLGGSGSYLSNSSLRL